MLLIWIIIILMKLIIWIILNIWIILIIFILFIILYYNHINKYYNNHNLIIKFDCYNG